MNFHYETPTMNSGTMLFLLILACKQWLSFCDFFFFQKLFCKIKYDPCNDKEIDERSEEWAEKKMKWSQVKRSASPCTPWYEECNDGHKDSVDRCGDQSVELAADNDSDGESDHAV